MRPAVRRLLAELARAVRPAGAAPACRARAGAARTRAVPGVRCAALPWLRGPRCPRCGLPRTRFARARRARRRVRRARGRPWPIQGVGAGARRRAEVPRRARRSPTLMAAQMAATLPARRCADADVGARARCRRSRRAAPARGFDPAGVLARALARAARAAGRGVPACGATGRRARSGGPRASGGRRAGSSCGCAARRRRGVVLVDDVHTTGATLDACARARWPPRARDVAALSYARTL